jgi:Histidine kinase-, DNA gyrase B-, and HSP90-like ATPase
MHRTICEFLLDLVENSLEAGASRLRVSLVERGNVLSITIRDNGKGMTADELARAADPFYTDGRKHPERSVGLGLSFAAQAAAETGGRFTLHSKVGTGTILNLRFPLDHVDCPPMGDPASGLAVLFGFGGGHEMELRRERERERYSVRRSDLLGALGNLEDVESRNLVREYLASCENELLKGENNGKDEFGRAQGAQTEQTA